MPFETKQWCRTVGIFVLVAVALATTTPAEAQRDYEPLFDTFNFRLEGSWVGRASIKNCSVRGGALALP